MTTRIDTLEMIGATYAVLSSAFDYPDEELWSQLEGRALNVLINDLGGDDADGLEGGYVFPVRSQDEREVIYLDLFELGRMPLYEHSFRPKDGREGIQEDLLRFYHFFAVQLGERNRDFPDHIATELEFMMYLVGLEAATVAEGRDPTPFRLAQRDFLDRHVLIWAAEIRRRQFEADGGVYAMLARWLDAFTRRHRDALEEALAVTTGDERPSSNTHLA
jgi:DMSO reductase family type II enzyme chaperone